MSRHIFSCPTGRLRRWAHRAQRDLIALWLAARDPRLPRPARIMALLVVTYALSPIDLIPDWIPVFGLLDDLLLVPLGIGLTVRMVPPEVMADCRARAANAPRTAVGRYGAALITALWITAVTAIAWLVFR